MSTPRKDPGAVPTSSQRNRFATKRTLIVAGMVLAFLLLAIWTPW